MTEHSKRLHDLLAQLHSELEAAEDLDVQTESELRSAIADIRAKLTATPSEDAELLTEEIDEASRHHGTFSEAAREFSATHPILARTIGQLADILGQSGI